MRRLATLVVAVCLAVSGCEEDPARSVKIVDRPTSKFEPAGTPSEFRWRPELCPPQPETEAGDGTFASTGACAFEQHGGVDCTTLPDDFIMEMTRPAARGATLSMYLNVEQYHGPGSYEEVQMLVSVQDRTGLFRWRSDEVVLTVGEDGKSAEVKPVRLEALPPGDETEIQIGGRLWCRPETSVTRATE